MKGLFYVQATSVSHRTTARLSPFDVVLKKPTTLFGLEPVGCSPCRFVDWKPKLWFVGILTRNKADMATVSCQWSTYRRRHLIHVFLVFFFRSLLRVAKCTHWGPLPMVACWPLIYCSWPIILPKNHRVIVRERLLSLFTRSSRSLFSS